MIGLRPKKVQTPMRLTTPTAESAGCIGTGELCVQIRREWITFKDDDSVGRKIYDG